MCLGIPGRIIEITSTESPRMCRMDFGGVIREVCLEAIPEAKVDNYAIVHAGFALNLLSEDEARETLKLLDMIAQFDDEEIE